jgi:hypothetical protein
VADPNVTTRGIFFSLKGFITRFSPEIEKKLEEISAQTGQPVPEIVQDVVAERLGRH